MRPIYRWGRAVLVVLLAAFAAEAAAQCVMCKAVAEDSAEANGLGRGLNTGILYLMAVPYVLLAVFGFLWYRNRKRATAAAEGTEA
jgi:hypothetical protein